MNRVLSSAVAVLLAALALGISPQSAHATKFDGSWNMIAVTTKGHCGTIYIGLSVAQGRLSSTSGLFALYPINLGGRVYSSGYTKLKAVAGPRTATGTGRFHHNKAGGKWKGRGPSGLCSGYWRANRY